MTMNSLVSKNYQAQLMKLHEQSSAFGKGNVTAKHYKTIITAARNRKCTSVLDFGCGKGDFLSNEEVKSYFTNISGYDVANPDYAQLPKTPYDLVVALDVLEHVEWGAIKNVLGTISTLASKTFICSIANYPAIKNLPDGRNAHITQLPFSAWFSILSSYFVVEKYVRTSKAEGLFICGKLTESADWR